MLRCVYVNIDDTWSIGWPTYDKLALVASPPGGNCQACVKSSPLLCLKLGELSVPALIVLANVSGRLPDLRKLRNL